MLLLAFIIALVVFVVKRLRSYVEEDNETLYWYYQNEWLKNAFNNYDVGVYGFRGSGKDVIFAHVINLIGDKHYSNITYNENTEKRPLSDLNVGGNSYDDLINENIKRFEPNFEEGCHFYISDAGVYLGCQYNTDLNKKYSEIPVHIALRRHLYNSHVHTNSQALSRPWDKVREQQGCFIHCLGVTNYGEYLIVSTITYTRYESAVECLAPLENPTKYDVMRLGEIAERKFKVAVETLTYDSRHFKMKLLINREEEKINERATIIV